MSYFKQKDINVDLLEEILSSEVQVQNPILGYYAQYQLKKTLSDFSPKFLNDFTEDGDLSVKICGSIKIVELKMVSKGSLKKGGVHYIKLQSSNCNFRIGAGGIGYRTCKYLVGTFDIAAACTHPIDGKWNFLFLNASHLVQDGRGFWKSVQKIDKNWRPEISKAL